MYAEGGRKEHMFTLERKMMDVLIQLHAFKKSLEEIKLKGLL